eukprot:12927459-Prorocentrum_lima.AAC.1
MPNGCSMCSARKIPRRCVCSGSMVRYRSRGVCAVAGESCGSLKQVSWALGSLSRAGVRVSVE